MAKLLPKGAKVIGHDGGLFEITNHYEFDTKQKGRLKLTHLKSNLKLKTFDTTGSSPSEQKKP